MVGIRWKDWNTMPTLRPRKRASASSSSVLRFSPATVTGAGIGPLQPGHHHQQRRFAGAGRADQADRLAAAYMQIDVLEDMDARRAPAEREIDPGQRDGRAAVIEAAWGVGHVSAHMGESLALVKRSVGR